MAWAHVQSRSVQAGPAGTVSLAFTSNVTAGNSIHVGAGSWAQDHTAAGAMTDTLGNTYGLGPNHVGNSRHVSLFDAPNIAGGACTITFNPSGADDAIEISIMESSGLVTSSPRDVSQVGNGTSGTQSPGTTAATAQADELVVITGLHTGTGSAAPTATGFVIQTNVNANNAAFLPVYLGTKVVAATGTQTASISWTNAAYAHAIATYKIAPPGKAPPPPRRPVVTYRRTRRL